MSELGFGLLRSQICSICFLVFPNLILPIIIMLTFMFHKYIRIIRICWQFLQIMVKIDQEKPLLDYHSTCPLYALYSIFHLLRSFLCFPNNYMLCWQFLKIINRSRKAIMWLLFILTRSALKFLLKIIQKASNYANIYLRTYYAGIIPYAFQIQSLLC